MDNAGIEIIKKLIEALGVENQSGLAKRIGVGREIVSRWKDKGFPKGTGNIIRDLIAMIDHLENHLSKYDRYENPIINRKLLIDEIMNSCIDGVPPKAQKANIVLLIKHLELEYSHPPTSVKAFLNELGLKTFKGKKWTVPEIKALYKFQYF